MYIREAHPDDGWGKNVKLREGVVFKSPKDQAERAILAAKCAVDFKLSMPFLMDGMDDAVSKAWGGWPDRLAVIDIDGRIAHYSGPGPGGFKPKPCEQDLKKILANGGRSLGYEAPTTQPTTRPARPAAPPKSAPAAKATEGRSDQG